MSEALVVLITVASALTYFIGLGLSVGIWKRLDASLKWDEEGRVVVWMTCLFAWPLVLFFELAVWITNRVEGVTR